MPELYNRQLQERMARQQAFFAGCGSGDLLVYVNRKLRFAYPDNFLCLQLFESGQGDVLQHEHVEPMITAYLCQLRDSYRSVYGLDDDLLPCANVYCGIGSITAAMTGREPVHDGITSWLEPNLTWEEIGQLRFDPDNRWVQFTLHVNQSLWEQWEEDFLLVAYRATKTNMLVGGVHVASPSVSKVRRSSHWRFS